MFFGLEVKSNQSKGKTLDLGDKNLKLSQAVLEPTKNGKREPVSLVVEYEKKEFILAVLDPSLAWQSPLDILFEAGSKVRFSLRGTGTVHITGFYDVGSDFDTDLVSMSSDEDYSITDSDYEASALPDPKEKSLAQKTKNTKKLPGKAVNGLGTPDKKKTAGKKRSADELDDDDDDDDEEDEDYDGEDDDDMHYSDNSTDDDDDKEKEDVDDDDDDDDDDEVADDDDEEMSDDESDLE